MDKEIKCSLAKCLSIMFICLFVCEVGCETYSIDDSGGIGRSFDGIGAISGGGATSKLLINYPEPYRTHILDYLFMPNFGASIHILKVEIGGDSQSSEGTEASHMHEPWDENYQRGYEWWLMKEAKKRNPKIKLYGLPWSFPGWIGQGTWWPYQNTSVTAEYVLKWVLGAKKYHKLDIDYIGIWNEKPYNNQYIKVLRDALNKNGFSKVRIVAADLIGSDSWSIAKDMKSDKALNDSVDIIGGHYTGTYTTREAQASGKPLWSSEDYSNRDSEDGAGCLARLLNQNYVNGYMTSTIVWNMLASYYNHLAYDRDSLMTAQQPWSGYYEVSSPIWAAAHTTQFTEIGWQYLDHYNGVQPLDQGGSIVTLVSQDRQHVSVVIETIDSVSHPSCIRPPQSPLKAYRQNITLLLKGNMSKFKSLNLWHTKLGYGGSPSTYFKSAGKVAITGGQLSLQLDVNSIYTLTSLSTARHGAHPKPPPPKLFPLPYADNFESYSLNQEPVNFAQQVGVFEVVTDSDPKHNKVMQQVLYSVPIHWCPVGLSQPIAVLGNYNWTDIKVAVDVKVEALNGTQGVFIAAHVDRGGCRTMLAKGVYFFIFPESNSWQISGDLTRTDAISDGFENAITVGKWINISLSVKAGAVTAAIDGRPVYQKKTNLSSKRGFVALGTDNHGVAKFDNFKVESLG